ncbi:MAG TPA: DUF1848 domain-containing protein [Firmicutes bacterium]|nr:DUF1848 domain-containing protein [Bacillota bacterium]
MIISASRRTDIPAYYSDWFFNRIKEKYVLVRNPMNIRQVSKISLSREVCDGIVFWTKNPLPMMSRLDEISEYPYYFQFTLNAYDNDIEKRLPSKSDVLIPAFIKLADMIGKERVIWRYDPILFNKKYTPDYHIKYFEMLVQRLCGYTEKCTVSFLDNYRSINKNMKILNVSDISDSEKYDLIGRMAQTAKRYGIYIETCAEAADFTNLGVGKASCIDAERLGKIGGVRLKSQKDKNQRKECGCTESIDIGTYNTCRNGCMYCYANHSDKLICSNVKRYNAMSELLCGEVGTDDIVIERSVKSLRECQTSFFGK